MKKCFGQSGPEHSECEGMDPGGNQTYGHRFSEKEITQKRRISRGCGIRLEPVSPVDIEMEYQRKEFKDELFLALYNKNEMWCEIILQLDVEGVAPAELAQRLGISLNHLRVKHHRAKSWLRSRFGKELEELF